MSEVDRRKRRVLVIQELGDYEILMLPGEKPEKALQRYLDADSQDAFNVRVRERASWVEEREEVTP